MLILASWCCKLLPRKCIKSRKEIYKTWKTRKEEGRKEGKKDGRKEGNKQDGGERGMDYNAIGKHLTMGNSPC